jgi:hypothetical protein
MSSSDMDAESSPQSKPSNERAQVSFLAESACNNCHAFSRFVPVLLLHPQRSLQPPHPQLRQLRILNKRKPSSGYDLDDAPVPLSVSGKSRPQWSSAPAQPRLPGHRWLDNDALARGPKLLDSWQHVQRVGIAPPGIPVIGGWKLLPLSRNSADQLVLPPSLVMPAQEISPMSISRAQQPRLAHQPLQNTQGKWYPQEMLLGLRSPPNQGGRIQQEDFLPNGYQSYAYSTFNTRQPQFRGEPICRAIRPLLTSNAADLEHVARGKGQVLRHDGIAATLRDCCYSLGCICTRVTSHNDHPLIHCLGCDCVFELLADLTYHVRPHEHRASACLFRLRLECGMRFEVVPDYALQESHGCHAQVAMGSAHEFTPPVRLSLQIRSLQAQSDIRHCGRAASQTDEMSWAPHISSFVVCGVPQFQRFSSDFDENRLERGEDREIFRLPFPMIPLSPANASYPICSGFSLPDSTAKAVVDHSAHDTAEIAATSLATSTPDVEPAAHRAVEIETRVNSFDHADSTMMPATKASVDKCLLGDQVSTGTRTILNLCLGERSNIASGFREATDVQFATSDAIIDGEKFEISGKEHDVSPARAEGTLNDPQEANVMDEFDNGKTASLRGAVINQDAEFTETEFVEFPWPAPNSSCGDHASSSGNRASGYTKACMPATNIDGLTVLHQEREAPGRKGQQEISSSTSKLPGPVRRRSALIAAAAAPIPDDGIERRTSGRVRRASRKLKEIERQSPLLTTRKKHIHRRSELVSPKSPAILFRPPKSRRSRHAPFTGVDSLLNAVIAAQLPPPTSDVVLWRAGDLNIAICTRTACPISAHVPENSAGAMETARRHAQAAAHLKSDDLRVSIGGICKPTPCGEERYGRALSRTTRACTGLTESVVVHQKSFPWKGQLIALKNQR